MSEPKPTFNAFDHVDAFIKLMRGDRETPQAKLAVSVIHHGTEPTPEMISHIQSTLMGYSAHPLYGEILGLAAEVLGKLTGPPVTASADATPPTAESPPA